MIATKNYIEKKFGGLRKSLYHNHHVSEWMYLDINRNRDTNLFNRGSMAFNLKSKVFEADMPVLYADVEEAIDLLDSYGFKIKEIHAHQDTKHIHIEGIFDKYTIDLLAKILQ